MMKLPVFKGATLAAGKAGVTRNIEHINMMDAPDIADYLHHGELLVTTAYHLKDRPFLLKELIELRSYEYQWSCKETSFLFSCYISLQLSI
ncbi:hypothetical protein DT075_11185 [Bacillus licheniformis]|nr:hypothetical protein DT075_11185 [Bacillus licheniformis]